MGKKHMEHRCFTVAVSASINFTGRGGGEFVTEEKTSVVCDEATENRELYTPSIQCPRRGGWPCRNFVKIFSTGKTRIIGLPYAEEGMIHMLLSRFDAVTDRHCY